MTNVLDRAKQFSDGVAIITEWLGSGARIVAKELAQKRANICIECPMNQAESFLSETIASASFVKKVGQNLMGKNPFR